MTIWKRVANLWAWSGLEPSKEQGFKWTGWVKSTDQPEVSIEVEGAQIIYPNPREEILKIKPDASLDDIANV